MNEFERDFAGSTLATDTKINFWRRVRFWSAQPKTPHDSLTFRIGMFCAITRPTLILILAGLFAGIPTVSQAHIPTPKQICDSWVNYHYPAGYAIYVFPTHLTSSPIPALVIPPQCIHMTANFKKFEVDK